MKVYLWVWFFFAFKEWVAEAKVGRMMEVVQKSITIQTAPSQGLYFRFVPSSNFSVSRSLFYSSDFFNFTIKPKQASKQTKGKQSKWNKNIDFKEEKKVDFSSNLTLSLFFIFLNQNLLVKIFTTKSILHLLWLHWIFFHLPLFFYYEWK